MMKRFVQVLVVATALALSATTAYAQTNPEAVVSWDVEFWAPGVVPGVGAPMTGVLSFSKATAICDMPQAVIPIVPVVNPTTISLDDPLLPGRACVLAAVQASGVLAALPLGNGIVATARARGATLISLRSAESNPFNRAIVVVAPTTPSRVVVRP